MFIIDPMNPYFSPDSQPEERRPRVKMAANGMDTEPFNPEDIAALGGEADLYDKGGLTRIGSIRCADRLPEEPNVEAKERYRVVILVSIASEDL